MQSFLVLVGLISTMEEKGFRFQKDYLRLGEEERDLWDFLREDLGKNFIRFSCLEKYPGLFNLRFEYYDFYP